MSLIPLIIDCDPGQDDAIALMLALASSEFEVLGITAVGGNVPIEHTAANARRIVEFVGRTEIPVFAGCAEPIRRPLVTAAHVHGETGLQGLDLPAPRVELAAPHAVEFLIETVRQRDGVTLCALGPLTNVAMALAKAPDIAHRLERIVLMGGARSGGNVTPVAEYNIFADPEAAAAVFGCVAPVVMVGLDVTHRALTTPRRLTDLRERGGRAGQAAAALCDFPARHRPDIYGGPGVPLHDPCVIAYLLRPDLFGGKTCNVMVETESELTRGQTVVDWWGKTQRPRGALVLDRIDADGVFALLAERLARL